MAVKKDQPNIHELDKKISIVSEIVNRMETNHLVHLKKDIDKIDFRVWAILGGMTLQLAATVVTLVTLLN